MLLTELLGNPSFTVKVEKLLFWSRTSPDSEVPIQRIPLGSLYRLKTLSFTRPEAFVKLKNSAPCFRLSPPSVPIQRSPSRSAAMDETESFASPFFVV